MDCTNSTVTGNEIAGPREVGIMSGTGEDSGDEYLDIQDNRISSANMFGIYISNSS